MSTKAYLFHLLDNGDAHTWNQDGTMGIETPENPRVVFEWEAINPKTITEKCMVAFANAHTWIQKHTPVHQFRQLIMLSVDDEQVLGASRLPNPDADYKPFPELGNRDDDLAVKVIYPNGDVHYLLKGDVLGTAKEGPVLRMAHWEDDPVGMGQIYSRAINVAIAKLTKPTGVQVQVVDFKSDRLYSSSTQ